MNRQDKQNIINSVTNEFRGRQWFNGAGFEGDKLIIAYNYYPALEMFNIKESLVKYNIEYGFKDIRDIMPNGRKNDDIPNYIK